MIATVISHASAMLLFAGGLAFLFVPEEILDSLSPGFPSTSAWIGQVVGAAWLGLAAQNWLQRRATLGGIYGRPLVFANLIHYFVAALVLFMAAQRSSSPRLISIAVPMAALALSYGLLLFRGPFGVPPNTRQVRQN